MFKKGHTPYNKNKKGLFNHSESTKLLLRSFNLGKKRILSDEARKNIGKGALKRNTIPPLQLGKKRSDATRKNLSLAHIGVQLGKKNPAWKGGISTAVNLIRSCQKYNEWRQKVFIRDNFTCRKCGVRGSRLEAHHVKAFKMLIEEILYNLPLFDLYNGAMIYTPLWDIENGETMCKKCHRKLKRR